MGNYQFVLFIFCPYTASTARILTLDFVLRFFGSCVTGGGTKGKSKTELLMAKPPKGRADGENGYFLATPSIVEYLDYGVDETYR